MNFFKKKSKKFVIFLNIQKIAQFGLFGGSVLG